MLEWKIDFLEIPKPTIKAVRSWDRFKKWLKQIELNTVYDFKNKAISHLQIFQCRKYYRIKEGYQFRIFERDRLRQNKIMISDEVQIEQLCCVKRAFWHNNQVTITSIFEIEVTPPTILRALLFNV